MSRLVAPGTFSVWRVLKVLAGCIYEVLLDGETPCEVEIPRRHHHGSNSRVEANSSK